MMSIPGYDRRKLATPWDDCHEIGTEDGQPCNRVHEPDEDAPRGYRPRPCSGNMVLVVDFDDRHVACDTCGELA